MYCPKCGKKSQIDDNFCIFCGEELSLHKNRKNLQDIKTKSNTSYKNGTFKDNMEYKHSEKPDKGEVHLASFGSRIGAYLIDMLIIFALVIFAVSIIANVQAVYTSESMDWLFYLLIITVFYGYFILLEGPLGKGKTVGKRALNLKVVKKKDHGKIGYGKSFVRNILRFIDWLPFFYIIGMIIIHDSDLNQRIGDKAAETIVIKEFG